MAQESWKREEEAGCQLPEGPVLCTNNCGFFGSVTTMNLCSKCYREHVLKQSKPPTSPPPVAPSIKSPQQFDLSLVEELPSKLPPSPAPPEVLPPVSNPVTPPAVITPVATPSALVETPASPVGASPGERLPNRCFACRKRVGLTGFKCRCGDVFCSLHRYSDKHNCSYDYKAAAREAIAKANPVVKAEKIEKI